jgi:hypothetical protein
MHLSQCRSWNWYTSTLIVFNIDYKNATSVQCLKASVIVFDKIEIIVVLPTHHARVHTSELAIEAPPQEKTPVHYAEEK